VTKHKKPDPRAARSKRVIKEAVTALLIENPDITKLTVQKIADRAELNRATFYLHFIDIADLLKHLAYDIFGDLSKEMSPALQIDNLNQKDQLIKFLDYLYGNRKLLAVLFEHSGFKKKVHMLLRDSLVIQKEKDGVERSLSEDILASSVLGIIIWWIKDGIHFSSEYVASQIIELYR
jgi:AcrR family transcriptional regulator